MKPYGAAASIIAALLLLPVYVFAADLADAPNPDSPKIAAPSAPSTAESSGIPVNPFLPGDELVGLSVGPNFPTFILPQTGAGASNLDLGVDFSVSYQYFVATGLALGGELGVAVNETIASSFLVNAPLGFTAAYWWTKLPFEFSIQGEVGGYYERDYSEGLFGMYAKAGPAVYWRATSDWSLGLNANFWLVPELHYGAYANLDQVAGFFETSITAVYHL